MNSKWNIFVIGNRRSAIHRFPLWLSGFVASWLVATAVAQAADIGTAFTYQGFLEKPAGTPLTDTCTLEFKLCNDAAASCAPGTISNHPGIAVTDGVFTVADVDFGAGAFTGDARWIEVYVQCTGDGGLVALSPRVELTPAPYALRAAQGVGPPGVLNVTPTGDVGIGTSNPTEKLDVVGIVHASDGISVGDTIKVCSPGASPNRYISSDGRMELYVDHPNALPVCPLNPTGAGADRALRLERGGTTPDVVNLIGGHVSNVVTAGVDGATIVGGGNAVNPNRVTDHYGTIGGGQGNEAGNDDAILGDASHATVGGGQWNEALADFATISGGGPIDTGCLMCRGGPNDGSLCSKCSDTLTECCDDFGCLPTGICVPDLSLCATPGVCTTFSLVGNLVTDEYGTIGGGGNNLAGDDNGIDDDADFATVGGGERNTAGDQYATVGGGFFNEATAGGSTIGGGVTNHAMGFRSTVGGGQNNEANGDRSTVGGGMSNIASGHYSTIPGGESNQAGGDRSFAAGWLAHAVHDGTFVWGDSTGPVFTSTGPDQFLIRAAGGVGIGTNAPPSLLTVNGAFPCSAGVLFRSSVNNTCAGMLRLETTDVINTGLQHRPLVFSKLHSDNGNKLEWRFFLDQGNSPGFILASTEEPGGAQGALALYATFDGKVGIGTATPSIRLNVVQNVDDNGGAVIENLSNTANARSVLSLNSSSSSLSLLAFNSLWPDHRADHTALVANSNSGGLDLVANAPGIPMRFFTGGNYSSASDERMQITSTGLVGIANNAPAHPLHVGTNATNGNGAHLTAGGTWTNGSSRDSKQNFGDIDKQEVLRKVAELPVTRWQYKGERESVHHIGPVAEDFHAAFGLGHDEKYITTIDSDGVALAAIQGLYEVVQEKDCEIGELRERRDREIEELRARLEKLEQMLASGKDAGR